jgi:hypothetical protein
MKNETDKKLIEIAHKRFKQATDVENDENILRVEDKKFVRLGEQWPEEVKRDRNHPGSERPMLTINRLLQFRNQIANEIRENTPTVKVRPADDDSDIKTADIFNGYLRHVQEASNADQCFETAADNQIDTGLGYFRLITDYAAPDSFDQDIKFQRVVDSASVAIDPSSTEPDGSDAEWGFVFEDVLVDDFKERWPNVDVTGWSEPDEAGWHKQDAVRVADYYYLESKPRTFCQLQDGSTGWKDEISEEGHQYIVKDRESTEKICKCIKLGGDQVLEKSELKTEWIPIIPVLGLETWVEGKRHLQGLTRPAKDSQRLYNYMESANAETLALAPKSPYIAAEGQLDGYELEWQVANKINVSVLTYNPVSIDGTMAPQPRREPPPQVNTGFESTANRTAENIKAVMGIYDASLGNREGDQSGRAINSQMKQASTSNFHFQANLARSVKHAGRIIISLIPSILDTARVIRILGEDGEAKTVKIDPQAPEAYNEIQNQDGSTTVVYNLTKGKYDVVADIGPSFATKRTEAVEAQLQMCQTDPTLMQIAGDIIVGNMDWPGAQEIAKRKKAMLPPQIQQIIQADDEEGKPKIDPQIEQQMNTMADQMQHLSQELQAAHDQINSEEEKLEIDRFNAQTKRLEVDHKIAMESTGLFHKIAMDQVAQTLSEPNDGEAEDPDKGSEASEKPAQQQPQQPQPQAAQPSEPME